LRSRIKNIKPLSTSVVGSFPAVPRKDLILSQYHTGEDPFIESMKESVNAQVKAGIEIISDGQTRNDMIRLFTTKLSGIRMKAKPVVIGEIGYRGQITVEDQKFVKKVAGNKYMLKGIITGPYTLASSCADEHYANKEKMAYGFAEALAYEARALDKVVDIVQVDEPFFSVEFPEYASGILETVFKGTKKARCLHVCGDVGRLFSRLVEFDVDILDHEFAAHPELLGTVEGVDFDQMIGYGCVRSDRDIAEDVPTILERIKKGRHFIGDGRMILDPDCGLRHMSRDVAGQKLANMVKARDVMRDES
jgi:5-methyltetrahydropteroyltriglutamate--homocysteine methyltransferase